MGSMSGDEEKTWGFIAWLIPLIGGILVLLFKPSYRYARHWAYLSISFFVVAVVASAVATIISIVPFLAPLGWAISAVLGALLLVAWVLGILKSLNNSYWNPPIIYDLARRLGL